MPVDFDKPLQTREGVPVTLITRTGRGEYPVIGYIEPSTDIASWTAEGNYLSNNGNEHSKDLVNAPVKFVRYVNVYQVPHADEEYTINRTRERADMRANNRRIACVRIEFTEGQFDD